jgi:hypothetical protein
VSDFPIIVKIVMTESDENGRSLVGMDHRGGLWRYSFATKNGGWYYMPDSCSFFGVDQWRKDFGRE